MTDDELLERLQEFPQVGPERAAEIVALVREYEDTPDVADDLRNARAYFDAGDHDYAMKFFERAYAAVVGDV